MSHELVVLRNTLVLLGCQALRNGKATARQHPYRVAHDRTAVLLYLKGEASYTALKLPTFTYEAVEFEDIPYEEWEGASLRTVRYFIACIENGKLPG